ncbi:RAMP superfamily CRISPR-associated protein [Anthocerotibacter panamensis]|uniref:RAMP superfamily CRISPR-associated protein n=1 Tax=Anthocerotibacter panamensis TaxID=2857077 RepID=UPI001C406A96|nr:RAMP superfamily CRISPR-associated protein [Anthocerotibacter panamensis]
MNQRPQRQNPPGNNPPRQGGGRQQPAPIPEPSPWLEGIQPNPGGSASFVEYLRWLRQKSGSTTMDAGTQVQLLSKFDGNNFSTALNRLTNRTRLLANPQQGHVHFEVTCPWRIRVGGTKGPESMLLPAFDNLGMPYIPSSTLRGVARAMAVKEIGEEDAKKIFGSIDVNQGSMGKVTFLDAYPLPGNNHKGGLKPDMANAIWKWNGNNPPTYSPNPNTFLSLEKPTFVIGLRRNGCSDDEWANVQKWLKNGLAQGIGSQVNSGYGSLEADGRPKPIREDTILQVPFELEGQLSHGRKRFIQWNLNNRQQWQMRGASEAEVRPVAFKNMLRYWFRSLAFGVLPPQQVRLLEVKIFGGIEPAPHTGLFRVEIRDGRVVNDNAQSSHDPSGLITGNLVLRNSSQTRSLPEYERASLPNLLKNLTWLMFHLGGVGQGARRPCYSRQRSPWYRGSKLLLTQPDSFFQTPDNPQDFALLFSDRSRHFFEALALFSNHRIRLNQLNAVTQVSPSTWAEAFDVSSRLYIVSGEGLGTPNKSHALDILHDFFHQITDPIADLRQRAKNSKNQQEKSELDQQVSTHLTRGKNLCGGTETDYPTSGDSRNAIPSPVWIADYQDFQLVLVFGATKDPRSTYLKVLLENSERSIKLWPFPNP